MKVVAGIVGGFGFAVLAVVLITTSLAALRPSPTLGVVSFIALWTTAIYASLRAPAVSAAWKQLLLSSGLLALLLPIAGMIYGGTYLAKLGSTSVAATAGAAIGGGLVTGVLGFVGFFLGIVLLMAGFLIKVRETATFEDTTPGRGETMRGRATNCPHCGQLVPIDQEQCNHCLNRITWIKGKAYRPSRPAETEQKALAK
jgi:hypothetical protein